jgi:hypothetical protein
LLPQVSSVFELLRKKKDAAISSIDVSCIVDRITILRWEPATWFVNESFQLP